MFVQAADTAPLALDDARSALDRAVLDGGLILESHRACDEADAFLMRVHAGEHVGLAKQVRVHVLPARQIGRNVSVAFRWEATGPAGRLYPTVDGSLTLTSSDANATTVTVTASYRPPLGRLGDSLDRTVLAGLADCTMTALVHAVVEKLVVLAGATTHTPPTDAARPR